MAALQVRPKAPHQLNLRSMSLLHGSSGLHYGMHPSQLAVAQVHHRAILFKHISAWVRHAGICPVKHLCPVFTAGLTSMLPLIRSVTSHAWFLQAQDIEHCIRPIEMQYPVAADLLRQLLYLDPLQRPSAAQGLQHTWFCQT